MCFLYLFSNETTKVVKNLDICKLSCDFIEKIDLSILFSPILPNAWYQAPADALLVIGISGQPSRQHLLFVVYASDNEYGINTKHQQCPSRAQHYRHREEHEQGGCVHRMTHNAVQSRVNELLILLHLNGS